MLYKWRTTGPVAICADSLSIDALQDALQDALSSTNLYGDYDFFSEAEWSDYNSLEALDRYITETTTFLSHPGFKIFDWNPAIYYANLLMQDDADYPPPLALSSAALIGVMDKIDTVFKLASDTLVTDALARDGIRRKALSDYFINMAASSSSRSSPLQVVTVTHISRLILYMIEVDKSALSKRIFEGGSTPQSKGGFARAEKLTKEQRTECARTAAKARWAKAQKTSTDGCA